MKRQGQDGWTEVRRRSTLRNVNDRDGSSTTFFVSKLPTGVNREELKRKFSRYGQVSDVYIANKKDASGNLFAFIRFQEVGNVKELEKNLEGITICGSKLIIGELSRKLRLVRGLLPPLNLLFVDDGHFVEILGRQSGTYRRSTKYLGGLVLALEFSLAKNESNFLSEVANWKDWFKWLKMGENQKIQYERVAWLKIVGLPIPLWDEKNFSIIAAKFGMVINPFDFILNRDDWSMGKVGILTSRKKWINEEITVMANNENFQIGVVEYTDGSPFKPCPFDKMDSSEDGAEDDDQDDDGISDTWIGMDNEVGERNGGPGSVVGRRKSGGRWNSKRRIGEWCLGRWNEPEGANGVGPSHEIPEDRRLQRKRVDCGDLCRSPNLSSDNPNNAQSVPASIYLNNNPCPSNSCAMSPQIEAVAESQENEEEVTARIGMELGFQIEKRDLVMVPAGVENGEINDKQ
ncbi:hypothetical protein L1887_39153 [Cichorium endivia]|nr:hypothetical protein L1887_39153 [Cichorium endivia]